MPCAADCRMSCCDLDRGIMPLNRSKQINERTVEGQREPRSYDCSEFNLLDYLFLCFRDHDGQIGQARRIYVADCNPFNLIGAELD